MKKFSIIALVVLAGASWACRKNVAEPENPYADAPWAIDESLPVPIQFRADDPFYIDTKAPVTNAPVSTLAGLEGLEIMAFDLDRGDNPISSVTASEQVTINAAKMAELNASSAVALFRAKAKGSNDGTVIDFVDDNGAAITRYYPMESGTPHNHVFYGYYIPQTASLSFIMSGGGLYSTFTLSPVAANNSDILWAKAEAADFEYDSRTYHGFNAAYIRTARLANQLEAHKPLLDFKHCTSAIHLVIKAADADAAATFAGGALKVGNLRVWPKYPYAKMNMLTGDLVPNDWRTGGILSENRYDCTASSVTPTVDGVELGGGIFLIPGEREGDAIPKIQFSIITAAQTYTPDPISLEVPSGGFVAGRRYTYYIYVKSLEQFQIKTTLQGWTDGTFDNPGDNVTIFE